MALSILIAPALYHHYLAIMILPLLIGLRHTTNVVWAFVAFILMSVGGQSIEGDATAELESKLDKLDGAQ